MPFGMKKILLLFSVCAVCFACNPDPVKYGGLIIGAWEVKEREIDISGAGDNYDMLRLEMREKFDWIGEVFEFKTGNIVTDSEENDGTYYIVGDRLQMKPAGSGGEALNFTIVNLKNRSLIITYEAVEELPVLTEHFPELTKCLVTITATKKNKLQNNPQ